MSKTLERPLTALDAMFVRRSVRSYAPGRLDRETIRALLDAAVQAPTAMHEEPWAFVVIQDPALLTLVSDRAKRLLKARSGPHGALHDALHGVGNDNLFYDAGTLIIICAKPMGPFVDADCWLAAENLMLAATALGLGSCCIGSAVPALLDADIKAELRIPVGLRAVVPIVVGIPAGDVSPSRRREPEILYWK
jgi:nitroreductase